MEALPCTVSAQPINAPSYYYLTCGYVCRTVVPGVLTTVTTHNHTYTNMIEFTSAQHCCCTRHDDSEVLETVISVWGRFV